MAIAAADDPTLGWLVEFLAPWFEPTTGAAADYRIAVRIDPAAETTGVAATSTVSPFLFDSPAPPLPSRDEGDRLHIHDAKHGAVYVVAARERSVEIVARSAGDGLRVALMRTVRELATLDASRHGALLLHAAAWDSGHGAVVVAGPKGGGKTTLLLRLLEHVGGRFVANDRCLVRLDGDRATVSGMPTIVSIRPSTLALLPDLAGRLRESGYQHTLTIAECRGVPRVGRPDLSPAQLCDLTRVEAVAARPLGALVFLDADPPSEAIELHRLPAEAAAARVSAALFAGGSAEATAAVWLDHASGERADRHAIEDRIARLVARVPCFACRIDRDVPLAADVVLHLVDRLPGKA